MIIKVIEEKVLFYKKLLPTRTKLRNNANNIYTDLVWCWSYRPSYCIKIPFISNRREFQYFDLASKRITVLVVLSIPFSWSLPKTFNETKK